MIMLRAIAIGEEMLRNVSSLSSRSFRCVLNRSKTYIASCSSDKQERIFRPATRACGDRCLNMDWSTQMNPFSEIVVLGKASEETMGGGIRFTDPDVGGTSGHSLN